MSCHNSLHWESCEFQQNGRNTSTLLHKNIFLLVSNFSFMKECLFECVSRGFLKVMNLLYINTQIYFSRSTSV